MNMLQQILLACALAASNCAHASICNAQALTENCVTPRGTGLFNGATKGVNHWVVQRNTPCHFTFHVWAQFPIDDGSVKISRRPENGIAGVNNSIGDKGFAYQPNHDFLGADSFQVTWTRKEPGSNEDTHVFLDVTVDVVEAL
jgi:hypothetical protein